MQLLRDYVIDERDEIMENDIRLIAIGDIDRLPEFVQGAARRAHGGVGRATAHDAVPRAVVRRARVARRGGAEAGGGRRGAARSSRGDITEQHISERPADERPAARSTCSCAPRASSACRTSCSGSRPTPSSTSPTPTGPTSARKSSTGPSSRIRGRERRFGRTREQIRSARVGASRVRCIVRNLALRVLTAVVALPLVGALIVWREPLAVRHPRARRRAALALTEYVHLALATAPRAAARRRSSPSASRSRRRSTCAPSCALVWVAGRRSSPRRRPSCSSRATSRARARGSASRASASSTWALLPASLALLHRDAPHGAIWVCAAIAVTFGQRHRRLLRGAHARRATSSTRRFARRRRSRAAWAALAAGVGILSLGHATVAPTLTVADCVLVGGPGRRARAHRRSRRVDDQALGGRQGLGQAPAGPRRHARSHRRAALRLGLDLRLRPAPVARCSAPNGKNPRGECPARAASLTTTQKSG